MTRCCRVLHHLCIYVTAFLLVPHHSSEILPPGCHYANKAMNCDGAGIENFPPKKVIPQDAEVILLTNNNLTSLPRVDVYNVSLLKAINLSHNEIGSIEHDAFTDLTSLEVLDLSYNKLKESALIVKISRFEFSHFRSLKFISFRGNPLGFVERMAFTSFGYSRLEFLDLSRCDIKTLQHLALDNLVKLQVLDLSYNLLEYFDPESIFGLIHLEKLDLSNNRIKTLQDLPLLRSLRAINLSHNLIGSIRDNAFGHAPNLKDISLKNNRLFQLNHLQVPWNTSRVALSGNPWKCDCNMRYLKEMKFSAYKIHIICASPSRLKGRSIGTLHAKDLKCVTSLSHITISTIVSQCFALLAGIIGLVCYKKRHMLHRCFSKTNDYSQVQNPNFPIDQMETTDGDVIVKVDDKVKVDDNDDVTCNEFPDDNVAQNGATFKVENVLSQESNL